MADNPLQDNTQATEQATEQGREQLRATQELTRSLEQVSRAQQAMRAIPSPRPTYVTPPPRPTQAPPPARPTQIAPPFHAGFPDFTGNAVETAALGRQYQLNRQLSQQWAQRMANMGAGVPSSLPPNVPPPPPPAASAPPLPGTPGGRSFDDYLRAAMAQQQTQSPIAQQAEQVQQQEIQRREKLNRELGLSERALHAFTRGLASGNPAGGVGGALGAMGPAGSIAAAAVMAVIGREMQKFQEHQAEIHRGGQNLSPAGAQTEGMSRTLREMEQARREGELERQNANALLEQRRKQALQLGLRPTEDPLDALRNAFGKAQGAKERSSQEFIRELFRTGSIARAKEAGTRPVAEYYEEFIRSRGGAPAPFKQDIPNLAESGYTTARRYHEELQVGALQREDLSNEKFKEQTAILRQMGLLLEGIRDNTNGLENLRPRWS